MLLDWFLLFFSGLASLGLELFVSSPSARLPTVTTIRVPDGLDWKAVIKFAMDK
jgi:alanine-glyoxylate transaminase/serine-glyoxylate transaminase/serine-pyruvate transaminase